MIKQERNSSVELLRIIAMLFILLGHTFFMGSMTISNDNILPYSLCSIINCMGVASVNVFILISGWFGITFRLKSLLKLLFQFFFLVWGIWFVSCVIKHDFSIDSNAISTLLGMHEGYWFVFSYLGLYILSPVLNSYVEHSSEKELRMILLSFYVFQCYYTWITDTVNYFTGYGTIFFCGLYLTARYVKKYPIRILDKSPFLIYVIVTLIITSIFIGGNLCIGNSLRMLRYDNPLVIIAAIAIVQTFAKLSFQSRCVNWLAASAFSVYIIHFHPCVFPYYRSGLTSLIDAVNTQYPFIVYPVYLCGVYLACTIVDQVRIAGWSAVNRLFLAKK